VSWRSNIAEKQFEAGAVLVEIPILKTLNDVSDKAYILHCPRENVVQQFAPVLNRCSTLQRDLTSLETCHSLQHGSIKVSDL